MHPICLSINTGRCGTTFLTNSLGATYPELACHHELVMDDVTNPRDYLGAFDPADFAAMRADPAVAAFLDRIAAESERQPFVDPGNNLVPLVPLIAATFPGRVRVLHLVREPVSVAASHTNFTLYANGTEDPEQPGGWWNNTRPPNPSASRCVHPEFANRWGDMTPFEKNLWRWAEYNLFALEFHRRFPDVPFLSMTSNELFQDSASALRALIAFYGLPPREPVVAPPEQQNATNPVLRRRFPVGDEWRRYVEYPHVLELAAQLGVPTDRDRLERQMVKYAAPSRSEMLRFRLRYMLTAPYWRGVLRRLSSRPPRGPRTRPEMGRRLPASQAGVDVASGAGRP
jgi:hypothetical protein